MSQPLRIHLEAPNAAPALAALLARVLEAHGANVHFEDSRCKPEKETSGTVVSVEQLKGLDAYFGRTTWVREEEADRWKVLSK